MNWNSNDTKYIIKRFVIYLLIAFAMFIVSTWKASALITTGSIVDNNNNLIELTSTIYADQLQNKLFSGMGEGNVIFAIRTGNITGGTEPLNEVAIYDNNNIQYICDIGNQQNYVDNTNMRTVITVICPIDLRGTNVGFQGIIFKRAGAYGSVQVSISDNATFVKTNSETQDVVNAINNTVQQQIQNNNTNSQAMQTAINNTIQQQQQTNQKLDDINNSINNDNITSSDADDFSSNQAFNDSTGLQSVIELPLNMVNSLTNTCQPIQVTIPFIDYTGEIPCMSTIYKSKFNTLYTIVKLVINGFFVYRLLLKIYELVHNAKQPDEDKLEVIDL